MNTRKKRMIYGLVTILFFLIELLIAVFVHDDFIRPYVGDVLVVVLLYTFVRIFVPEGIGLLPVYLFLLATFVEVLQYARIVEVLGLSGNRILSVIVGSVFDWKDIVCYGVGCGLLGVYEWRKDLTNLLNRAIIGTNSERQGRKE